MTKFINIVIKKNGVIIGTKGRGVWLDITDKKLFYLSWTDGRIYFFLDKLDSTLLIKNIQNNSVNKSVSFQYVGEWKTKQAQIIKLMIYMK